MRIVQVGCLGMGKHWIHIGRQSNSVQVVGYVDINPAHLTAIQDEFGIDASNCFTDLGEAIQSLNPDGVLLVTPPQFHAQQAIQAMQAGCHVLTEKPLAPTRQECLDIIATSKATGKIVMVAQNYRYRPSIQTLRQAVLSGTYGQVEQVSVEFFRGPHFGGFREEMDHPLIVDMAIHHFDLMRYILDADPISVEARSWNPSWSWFRGDASATCHFEMVRRKSADTSRAQDAAGTGQAPIHVVYNGSWCTRGGTTSWNGNWKLFLEHGYLELIGDRVYVQREEDGPKEEITIEPMPRTDQAYLLEAFVECVRRSLPPETSAEDNLKSIDMVFNAVKSCDTRSLVTF